MVLTEQPKEKGSRKEGETERGGGDRERDRGRERGTALLRGCCLHQSELALGKDDNLD